MKLSIAVPRAFPALAACLMLAAPAPGAATTSTPPPEAAAEALPERLDMYVGDTRVVDARTRRVAIGNGDVVDITTLDAGQLLILAAAAGTTAISLWLRDGRRHRIVVNVTERSLELVLDHVRRMLAGVPTVAARIAGERIVLEGDRVADADQRRVAAVVDAYGGTVVNLVGRLGWERMLHFDVRIVEVRRSAIRELGIRWDTSANGPSLGVIADFEANDTYRVGPPAALPGLEATAPLPRRVWPPAAYAGITSVLGSRLALLESRGDAVLLAQPTLSCRSGGSARFVSGGEFPIPVTDAFGSTNVQFKEYGVILDVKPVADGSGTIWAQVEAEISQLDESVRVLGVPGLLKRRSATELNLREGEVAVLAGLVNRSDGRDVARVPGLGRLPAVGGLFRSTARRGVETELLILITPRVVEGRPDPAALARDPNADGIERARELEREAGARPLPAERAP